MQRLVKVAFAAGVSLALSGCIIVGAVSGDVTTTLGKARTWQLLEPGTRVTVPAGASITIIFDPVTVKQCERTYTQDFVVPAVCKRSQDQEQQQGQDNQDPDQDQDPQQDQHQASNEGENGANGTEDSSGISAPQVTPTPVPDYSPGGEGGTGGIGMDGPQVIATGVPQYNVSEIVVTGTQLLEAALGIYATKKIGDELNDDDHKGNSEGQPISP